MNTLVSVIVPIFNAEKFLAVCVDSLLVQVHTNLEIILVDNYSTDSSLTICNSYAEKDPRVIVLHGGQKGANGARAFGFAHARGEYVCFVDSDDHVSPDYVSALVEAAEEMGAELAICGYCVDWGNCETENPVPFHGKTVVKDTYVATILGRSATGPNCSGFLCTRVYKRANVGMEMFDCSVNYMEDHLFNLAYAETVQKIAVVDKMLYHYVVNPSSLTQGFKQNLLEEVTYVCHKFEEYLLKYPSEENKNRVAAYYASAYYAVVENACKKGNRKQYYEEIVRLNQSEVGQKGKKSINTYSIYFSEKISRILIKLHLWGCLYTVRRLRIERARKKIGV